MNITLHFLDKNIVTELQQKFQGYNDFCRIDVEKGTITFLGSRAEPKRGGGTTYTAGAYKSGNNQAGAFAVTFPTDSLRNDFVRIAKLQNFSTELGDAADIDNSQAGQEKTVYFLKKVLPYKNISSTVDQIGSVGHIKFTFDDENKLHAIQAWVEKNKPKLDFIIVNLNKKMVLISSSKGKGTDGVYKTAKDNEYGINFPEGDLRNEFQNFFAKDQLKTEDSSKALYCTPEMQDNQPVMKAKTTGQQNASQPSTSTMGAMLSSIFPPSSSSDKVKKITKFPKFKNDQYIKAKLEVKTNQLIIDFESSQEQSKLTKEQLKFVKEHFMYQLQGLLAGQPYSLKLDANNKIILEMDFTQGATYQETVNKNLYFGTSQTMTSNFLSFKDPLAPQVANTLKFIEKALFSNEYGNSHPLISHDEKGIKKGDHDNTINPARVAEWPFLANPPQVSADDRILFYKALGEQYDGLQGFGPSTINIPRLAIEFPSVEARKKFLHEDKAFGLPCTVVEDHPKTVYIEPVESNIGNYQTGQRGVIAPINPNNLGPCGVYFSRGSGEGFEIRLEFPTKAQRKAFIEKMGTIQTTNSDRTIESYITDSGNKGTATLGLLNDCFRTVESFSPTLGKPRRISSFEGYYSTYNKGNKKASSVIASTPMSASSNAASAPIAPKNEFKLIIRYSDDAVFAQIKQFVKNNIQIKKFISINETDKAIVINAAPQKGEAGAYIATGKEYSINFPSEALRKEFQTLSLLRPSIKEDDGGADLVRQRENQKSAVYFNPNKYASNNNKAEISISYKTISSILREIAEEHCMDPVTFETIVTPFTLSTGHTYEEATVKKIAATTKKCPNTSLAYTSQAKNTPLQKILIIINETRSEVPDAVKFTEIKKLITTQTGEYIANPMINGIQDHMLRNFIQAFKQEEAEMAEIVKRQAVVEKEASIYHIPSSSTQAKQQIQNSAPSTSAAGQSSTVTNTQIEEERKKREEEQRKQEEERKKREEERRKQEEERKKQEEERKKREEEQRKLEEARGRDESAFGRHGEGSNSPAPRVVMYGNYYRDTRDQQENWPGRRGPDDSRNLGQATSHASPQGTVLDTRAILAIIKKAAEIYLQRCNSAKLGLSKFAHSGGMARAEIIINLCGKVNRDLSMACDALVPQIEASITNGDCNNRSGLNDALIYVLNYYEQTGRVQQSYPLDGEFKHGKPKTTAQQFLREKILAPLQDKGKEELGSGSPRGRGDFRNNDGRP